MSEIVSARLEKHQAEKLDLLVRSTGWTASEVLRKLVDAAVVLPPQVRVVVGMEQCASEEKEVAQ
jgi:hypothetical protein